jgi:hypothetical protein
MIRLVIVSVAAVLLASALLRAGERNPPSLSSFKGEWVFTSVAMPETDSRVADLQESKEWLVGRLNLVEKVNSLGSRLEGVLELSDESKLQVHGRVYQRSLDSPVCLRLICSGTAPSELGGPPLELEYELDGRCRRGRGGSIVIHGVIQSVLADRSCSGYTTGYFSLALSSNQ